MEMKNTQPIKTLIAGIGGFAASHHGVFQSLEERGLVRVIGTCDPEFEKHADVAQECSFEKRGVAVHRSFEAMLEAHRGGFDLGVVATPIHCHASMHKALVEAGAACYLEKPPTLDPVELLRMLEIEKKANFATNVGFLLATARDRIALKRRMVSGEFGSLKAMSFLGLAPRSRDYFARNGWAGRLVVGGSLVLDSCLGNALSHFLNSMFFFGGFENLWSRARPESMACELYRANRIEGADTVFAICGLQGGIQLRIAASHACLLERQTTEERLDFENANVTILDSTKCRIEFHDGAVEESILAPPSLADCVESYVAYLQKRAARPPQTLAESAPLVEANAMFYCAARTIHTIPIDGEGGDFAGFANCLLACERLVGEGLLPSSAGFLWSRAGGRCLAVDAGGIRDIVHAMIAKTC